MIKANRKGGFILLEFAIVLLLFVILMVPTSTSLIAYSNVSKHKKTIEKIDAVNASLQSYFSLYKRLPAPVNYVEVPLQGGSINNLNLLYGELPVLELGLSPDNAYDGYGSLFSYVVIEGFTAKGLEFVFNQEIEDYSADFGTKNSTITSFLQMLDGADGKTILNSETVYTLISHGKNMKGALNKLNIKPEDGSFDEINTLYTSSGDIRHDYFFVFNNIYASRGFDDVVRYSTLQHLVSSLKTGPISGGILCDSQIIVANIISTSNTILDRAINFVFLRSAPGEIYPIGNFSCNKYTNFPNNAKYPRAICNGDGTISNFNPLVCKT